MLVAAEFLRRGVPVYRPIVDTGADLVVDINGKFQRVQVKTTEDDSRRVSIHLQRRRRRGEKRPWCRYGSGELDWHAICCLSHNYIALVPAGQAATTITFDEGKCGERLKEIEIGAVIERLMGENK